MKVHWEFYKSEINNDNMIAAMLDEDGKYILLVYESNETYNAIFCKDYDMFKDFDIKYSEIYSYINKVYHDGYDDKQIHVKAFEYAYTKIEYKFYQQLQNSFKSS